jgi:hypothetical protein
MSSSDLPTVGQMAYDAAAWLTPDTTSQAGRSKFQESDHARRAASATAQRTVDENRVVRY